MEENKSVGIDTRPVWEKLQDKAEDLQEKVARYFEDRNDENGDKPPILKSPQQPTAEEVERHQTTHTPLCSMVSLLQRSTRRTEEPSPSEDESQLGARRGQQPNGTHKGLDGLYVLARKEGQIQGGKGESTTSGCY